MKNTYLEEKSYFLREGRKKYILCRGRRRNVCRQSVRNTYAEESGSHEELKGLKRDCKKRSMKEEKK